jgi:formylglycine-generating enzyme required for sulfatase activity
MGRGDADGDGNADGNYEPVQGTSFASPLAAGVAALMLSKNPNLTAQQVRNIMRSTCDKVDTVPYPDGRNDYYGYGRINAKKALDATESIAVPKSLPADLEVVASALYPSTTTTGLAPGSKEAQERQKQAVQQLKLPLEVKTRKTGIVFRLVPNGTFTITRDWGLIDIPAVVKWQVTLTKAFYCGKFEITGSQWRQVMLNDLPYVGLDTPARSVSWDECQAFVKKLCQIEGVADETYRLLTEAEWEYACLAGTQGSFYFASGPDGYDYDDLAANKVCCRYHYGAPSYMDRTLCFVGSFPPNAWGLHDTHGSVSEWCQDDLDGWMTDDPGGSVTDPFGTLGDARVLRGGSVHDEIRQCAVEATIRAPASMWSGGWGLRLARTAPSNP